MLLHRLHPPMDPQNPPEESESSDFVTDQTQSRTRPSQPPQFHGTITEDSGAAWPEDSALPESMPGGADLVELQKLEHQLLDLRTPQPGNSIELAHILHRLGEVTGRQGHHTEAMEYLQESLRMQQSLHGDVDHPGIASTLHQIGHVTAQTGDLKEALRFLKESLRMAQSLNGDVDHPGIAATLHEIGNVTAQTGDLKEALRFLKESLRMQQSLHGDVDHPGIAVTLHEIGNVTAQTGDLQEALRYHEKCFQIVQRLQT